MIEIFCNSLGRPRLSSSSTSGSHNSRFYGLAAVAFLVVVVIITPAAEAQTCAGFTDSQVDCLSTTPNSPNFIQISCVSDFYSLTIRSAALYQASSSAAGCPTSGPVNSTAIGACLVSNPQSCTTTSSSCLYAVSTPTSNVSPCTGPFFLVTTYQCNPVFSAANTTTGSSTFMDNTGVISNTQVNLGNPRAPSGSYFYGPTNYTCSVYVPAGVEVRVAFAIFTKTSGTGCQWRVEIADIANNVVAQFCNTSSPSVNLGCGPNPTAPQYFLLRYVGDSSVGIFFAISFQVRQGSQVTARCGYPPFPLYSSPPTTTPAGTTTRLATTVPTPAVTTAAAAVTTAGATSPPPSTASGNGPSTAATSGAPNLVVTTAPSNSAATSVFPTPSVTSANPSAAPATSNAVTSGVQTTGGVGGVTSAALTPAVTTAPSNNVPTSAPPAPSPTTGSPPVAPVTTAGAIAASSTEAVTSGALSSLPATGSSMTGSSGVVVTQPSTSASGGGAGGWDQNATIGVVTGSVIAGAIVLAIVAAIALWRRRSTEEKQPLEAVTSTSSDEVRANAIEPVRASNYQLDPHTYSTSPYRHVTGFYVDGNSRSNLVISRQTPQPPPQPFKTVLRLQ